jgi:MoxR-like ATPase
MSQYIITPWMEGAIQIVNANKTLGDTTMILLQGPPGASKTSFAEHLSDITGAELFELNVHRSMKAEHVFWNVTVAEGNQIQYTPTAIWDAFEASNKRPVVLLIDELDKSSERVEDLLLRAFEKFSFRNPFGTEIIGNPKNLVIIATSNKVRELGEPLQRRFHDLRI